MADIFTIRRFVDSVLVGFAGLVVWGVAQTWLADPKGAPPTLLDVHGVLMLDGSTQWAKGATRNVVLRARSACWACGASEPFYRRLASSVAASPQVRLVVISEDSVATTRKWLELNGVVPDQVHQWSDDFHMYPVIYLADDDGIVTNLWLGQLSPQEEETVVAMARNPGVVDVSGSDAGLPTVINETTLTRLSERASVALIDPRERRDVGTDGRRDTVNIPMREWPSRLPAEFDADVTFVVDCSYTSRLDCHAAGLALVGGLDYTDVYLFDPGE